MSLQGHPKILSKEVIDFCKKVSPNTEAVFLDVILDSDAKKLDCFENVKKYQHAHNGSIQYGWLIWEWPNVMIEGEFHAVWLSPNGKLVDVTPNEENFSRVLFLPDQSRSYEGAQVNNIRRSLKKSRVVRKYIDTHDKLYKAMNKGELAGHHGSLTLTPHMIELMKQNKTFFVQILQEEYGADWQKYLKSQSN